MKGTELIKDIIVSVLIVVSIVLILTVIFYDKISLSKVIPESEEYLITEEIQAAIDDSTIEATEEIVTKYYIDATDLKKYEQTKEYNKGKQNPFSIEETPIDTSDINSNNSTSTNNSTNFYEDDGTK